MVMQTLDRLVHFGHLQVVTEDGQHGNGWLTVQRLPEELWGSGTAKRVPLRRLALVYTPEEAAPLLQEELLKVLPQPWTI